MKTSIIIAALFVTLAGFSQEATVSFNNRNSSAGINAPISYAPGGPAGDTRPNKTNHVILLDKDWGGFYAMAGLYGGPVGTPEDQLVPLPPPAVMTNFWAIPFRSGSLAGYVDPNVFLGNALRVVPGAQILGPAVVQMRAWDAGTAVYSYEEALSYTNEGVYAGKSAMIHIVACGGGQYPPAPLEGLQSFSLNWLQCPFIREQLSNQVALAGSAVQLQVSAVGSVPLFFHWYFNNSLLTVRTNESLVIPDVQAEQAGEYYVVITNSLGSVTSQVATLTVVVPPFIISQPQSTWTLPGSNVTFTVTAVGTLPHSYQWKLNGTNIPGATDCTLTIENVQASAAGTYSVDVANVAGNVSSSPAHLDVRLLLVSSGNQLLLGPEYTFDHPIPLRLQTALRKASIFYTTDGTAPNVTSCHYVAPFPVETNILLRAIAYSENFPYSYEAPPLSITILRPPFRNLFSSSPGGGTITLDPDSGRYLNGMTVKATASALPGWKFLGWTGDAAGNEPTVEITMTRNKCIQAIFGTALSTMHPAGGTVSISPQLDWYPYGSSLCLSVLPDLGHSFIAWTGTAIGTNNPGSFTVTTPNPTCSAILAPLNAGDYSLAVIPVGGGRVKINPYANAYKAGQIVTLTALPDPHQEFLGWTGGALGDEHTITIPMSESKTIWANFTRRPRLEIGNCVAYSNSESLQFYWSAELGERFRIDESSDLITWTPMITLTNTTGTLCFNSLVNPSAGRKFYRVLPEPSQP